MRTDAEKFEKDPVKSCKNYLRNGKRVKTRLKDLLLGGGLKRMPLNDNIEKINSVQEDSSLGNQDKSTGKTHQGEVSLMF